MPDNHIDNLRPDAPEMAGIGPRAIGVQTLTVTDRGRVDVLKAGADGRAPRYDRGLKLEVWYPCEPENRGATAYEGVILRDGRLTATLHGAAMRDAEPHRNESPCPLIIISHGYPGNRFLMSHLGESLASHGFVVVSIDHAESTYDDKQDFASTLYHRPLDQLFVLSAIGDLSRDPSSFLHGLADASRTGLIGYSMGGYGALIAAGAGITRDAVDAERSPPGGLLAIHRAGGEQHQTAFDSRLKAVMPIAPWGMTHGVWNDHGLAGLRVPTLFVAGSNDETCGYDDGVAALFARSRNCDRTLLTFINAGHNVAAPYPAPAEAWQTVDWLDFPPFEHYADPVWDTVRMNNIAQHFAAAWFCLHLKGEAAMERYVYTGGIDGWAGFADGKAPGLILESLPAGEAR